MAKTLLDKAFIKVNRGDSNKFSDSMEASALLGSASATKIATVIVLGSILSTYALISKSLGFRPIERATEAFKGLFDETSKDIDANGSNEDDK